MKKVLSLVLSIILCVFVLCGCGSGIDINDADNFDKYITMNLTGEKVSFEGEVDHMVDMTNIQYWAISYPYEDKVFFYFITNYGCRNKLKDIKVGDYVKVTNGVINDTNLGFKVKDANLDLIPFDIFVNGDDCRVEIIEKKEDGK